jgi:predicted  nucleic acid-binding Zn-ribbon protein
MSDARTQLQQLLKMQELAIEIQEARAVVDGAPAKLEEAENRFRERNAEYVATKERFDAVDADRRARALDLATLEETKKHYQDSLMQVKNQREYAAVLKEIDAAKASIGEHEDAILASMEEVETLKADLEARTAHIESERTIVEKERADVEKAVADAQARIERALAERAQIESTLPAALVANVKRVEEGPKGNLPRQGRARELLRLPRAPAPAGLPGNSTGLEDSHVRKLPSLSLRRGGVCNVSRLVIRFGSRVRHGGRGGEWRSGLEPASTAAPAGIPVPRHGAS